MRRCGTAARMPAMTQDTDPADDPEDEQAEPPETGQDELQQ